MSMMPACRVTFNKNLSGNDLEDTVQEIRDITGNYNLQARGNPPQMILSVSMNSPVANKIRKLPGVARVDHQL